MSRTKISGDCHKCGTWSMRYTDNPSYKEDGTLEIICGGCEIPSGGNDPTFGSGNLPSLKGRAKHYRESLQLDQEATKHKVGSDTHKELKAEAKKMLGVHSNRKLTATEKEDSHRVALNKKKQEKQQ